MQTIDFTDADMSQPGSLAELDAEEMKAKGQRQRDKLRRRRNLAAFWLFGLCNNFAYVVMLSAAHDILGDHDSDSNQTAPGNSTTDPSPVTLTLPLTTTMEGPTDGSTEGPEVSYLHCNAIGTGAILLADILPTLVVKATFPFFIQRMPYSVKVSLICLFSAASFVVVALAHRLWLSILGVVCASIGAGLGEITFLSLSTFYHRDTVSSWSSGTGGAGILGAIAYAGLTSIGLSPRDSLLVMISVPVCLMLAYRFLLVEEREPDDEAGRASSGNDDDDVDADASVTDDEDTATLLDRGKTDVVAVTEVPDVLTMGRKLRLIPSLFKYMVPLSLVYFAEYFINQGLHELLYFNGQFLSRQAQYRWFQVDYQIGVFISRSSVNLVRIRKLWILPVLQFANLVLLTLQVFYRFIPSLWLVLAVVLWEGLLGGAAYVNTFYLMSTELAAGAKEFCMGVATLADSLGIALAGMVAVPTHNRICRLKLKM